MQLFFGDLTLGHSSIGPLKRAISTRTFASVRFGALVRKCVQAKCCLRGCRLADYFFVRGSIGVNVCTLFQQHPTLG